MKLPKSDLLFSQMKKRDKRVIIVIYILIVIIFVIICYLYSLSTTNILKLSLINGIVRYEVEIKF